MIALFCFTILYEIMIVVSTIAMVEKRIVLSPTLSALLELAKLVSLLFVIDSTNKILSVSIVMVACYIGNMIAILVLRRIEAKKKRRLESAQLEGCPHCRSHPLTSKVLERGI
jgi:hypothetical protein